MSPGADGGIEARRASVKGSGEAFAVRHAGHFDRLSAAWFLWLLPRASPDGARPTSSALRDGMANPAGRPVLPTADGEFWGGALDAVFSPDWWDQRADAVAAQMALGRALAHVVARRWDVPSWHLVEAVGQTTDFASDVLFRTLPKLMPEQGERRGCLLRRLEEVAADYVADPRSAAYVAHGIDAKAITEDLRSNSDVDELFTEPRLSSYIIFGWSGAFRLARRLMPSKALARHDLLKEPAAIRQCLADLGKPDALEGLAGALRAAPVAFDGERWIGSSMTAPVLLAMATEHLRAREGAVGAPERDGDEPRGPEADQDRADAALDAVMAALTSRRDAVPLGHHWMSSLIREAGLRGLGSGMAGRSAALRTAVDRLAADIGSLADPLDFVVGRARFRRTPAALAALATAEDDDGGLMCRMLVEASLDVGEQREMSDPWSPTRQLGGGVLARCRRPHVAWRQCWIEIFPQREAARYCLGGDTDRARHPGFLLMSWCLGALGYMAADREGEAAELWLEGWKGAIESRVNERFDLGFWDAATLNLAAFWAVLQRGAAPLPSLDQIIAPVAGSSQLTSFILTLAQNGVEQAVIMKAAEDAGLDLIARLRTDIAAERRDGRGRVMSDRAISDVSALVGVPL